MEGLDYAVTLKLADMLNKDFDAVLDLCEQQAQVWREQRSMPKDQRAQLEREQKRLEGAISRLLDQIEAGQAVTGRLKQRQEELDIIKSKLDMPPDFDREAIAALVAPLGSLCGLGMGDPVVIRQVLRKIGVDKITVWPEGEGWRFEGTANFGASFAQRRSSAPPPDTPHRSPAVASPVRPVARAKAPLDAGYLTSIFPMRLMTAASRRASASHQALNSSALW